MAGIAELKGSVGVGTPNFVSAVKIHVNRQLQGKDSSVNFLNPDFLIIRLKICFNFEF